MLSLVFLDRFFLIFWKFRFCVVENRISVGLFLFLRNFAQNYVKMDKISEGFLKTKLFLKKFRENFVKKKGGTWFTRKLSRERNFAITEEGIFFSSLGPTLYVCFLWTTTENGLEKLCRHQQGSGLHNFICLWPALPRLGTMKEIPRWRITASSSVRELWRGGLLRPPPPLSTAGFWIDI